MNIPREKQAFLISIGLTVIVITLSLALGSSPTRRDLREQEHQFQEKLAAIEQEILSLRGLLEFDTGQTIIYLKILVLNPQADPGLARQIAASVAKHSRAFGKDPDLVLAIIAIESSFDSKHFRSSQDAIGPMQVLRGKDRTICEGADLEQIDDNIRCGIKIYTHYEQEYGKDMATVLTAYNRGPSSIDLAIRDGRNPSNGYAERVTKVYDKLRAMPGINDEL